MTFPIDRNVKRPMHHLTSDPKGRKEGRKKCNIFMTSMHVPKKGVWESLGTEESQTETPYTKCFLVFQDFMKTLVQFLSIK